MDWADWAEYRTERIGVDGADWGRRGGLANEADGADGMEYKTRRNTRKGRLGRGGWTGRTGRTEQKRVDGVDWEACGGCGGVLDGQIGMGHLGQPASSRLRTEGIQDMLSPDADYGVIWLHTPGIHVRFFHAYIVVIFLGTDTSKAQRASPGDKFFGLLGALNITHSMFIQMGQAIRNVVIVTYKGGLSSLVPPSPLCTSCCS